MTEEQPAPEPMDNRKRLATELIMLKILSERVKEATDERRAVIESTWAGKDSVTLEIPSDNPARPLKIGTVRADGGQGVARISDPAAWQKWCLENYGHNVTHQPAGRTSWQLDATSRYALAQAGEAYAAATSGFGASPEAGVAALLDALEAEGYTLTKRADIPERIVVQPSWEKVVLEATQEAGAPLTPNGDIPEGVEFVPPEKAAVRPVVTVSEKDPERRTRFILAHRDILPALTGTITPEEAGNGR